MDVNQIVTKKDLVLLKEELLTELKESMSNARNTKKWLKSIEVQEMLSLSASGLQNLRVSGKIPFTKLSGVIYYDYDDILSTLSKNKKGTI